MHCRHLQFVSLSRCVSAREVVRTMPCRPLRSDMRTRAGFTLVELLVVLAIFVILAAMTITAVSVSLSRERIRSAARQIQSYIEGARDRAIFAGAPRGVRLILDPHDSAVIPAPSYTVSSMIYIGATDDWTEGSIAVYRRPFPPPPGSSAASSVNATVLVGTGTGWYNLARRGLLINGSRIFLQGNWYSVNISRLSATAEVMEISPPLRDTQIPFPSLLAARIPAGEYRLELQPSLLPNEEPVRLPPGIVIDLNHSELPPGWDPTVTGSPSYQMDLVFSSRGQMIGPPSAKGIIHLLLNDVEDTERGLFPVDRLPDNDLNSNSVLDDDELNRGDKLVVTIYPRTGYVTSTELFVSEDLDGDGVLGPGEDKNGNGLLDPPGTDLFYYAETGALAK